jgi:glycerol-3-phosphate dehydrogenase subunit B
VSYDAIVIGVGLAGLTAALRLAEGGLRVLVLAKGVGSTHLTGGTIDVLGYAPERVESPARSLPGFVTAHPDHPYARVGVEAIPAAIEWFKGRLDGYRYVGDLEENFLLPTAVGAAKPSAVVPQTIAGGDLRSGGRFLFVGLRGLKDFYPAYLAANVRASAASAGARIDARAVELRPPLDAERDVSALGFARRFERSAFRDEVVSELRGRVVVGEKIGFPALLGLGESAAVWGELQERLPGTVFEVPTLPPSVPGMRVFGILKGRLRRAGARVVIGGTVTGAEARDGEVRAVVVETASRPATYRARSFVLATGGFASGALEMDSRGRVREPLFDLPVAGVPDPGERRFAPEYLADHPLSRAGLAVDDSLRPVDAAGNVVFRNLYAAGAVLGGAAPWREASGDGLSLATGYAAASAVLAEPA